MVRTRPLATFATAIASYVSSVSRVASGDHEGLCAAGSRATTCLAEPSAFIVAYSNAGAERGRVVRAERGDVGEPPVARPGGVEVVGRELRVVEVRPRVVGRQVPQPGAVGPDRVDVDPVAARRPAGECDRRSVRRPGGPVAYEQCGSRRRRAAGSEQNSGGGDS